MADFTTVEKRSGMGWIVAVIVVALVVLYAAFGRDLAPTTGDGTARPDGAPAVETAPAAAEPTAPAPAVATD